MGPPLLRFRSDEQLVALFRAGYEEAFRAIHDRYHKRLFAYARQMLPGRQDAEDVLQDVFVRAYSGLRASERDLALRAWLFRVAHNRCIDELRKPTPPPPEVLQLVRSAVHDPIVELDLRESLRRLIEDIRRLPDQQRSALLMRELGGMSYAELASSLGITVGAVKSLLVRARLALAQAAEARDTACAVIREQLVEAHDHGVRPNANARKHMRDCSGCKSFRGELRGVSRQLAAFAPALGPLGFLAKVVGFSGGGGAAGGAGGGMALLGGGGTTATAGGVALGANHLATLIVAAVAAAGGAVEIQHTILHRPAHVARAQAHPGKRGHGASAATATEGSAVRATTAQLDTLARDPAAAVTIVRGADRAPLTQSSRPAPAARSRRVARRSTAGAGSAVLSGSPTAGGTATSTGTQPSGSCATAGPTAAAGTGGSTSTGSASTAGGGAGSTSQSGSAASDSSASCGADAGSTTGASTSSSGGSTATDGSASDGSTSTGSGSGPAASSGTGTGTSPDGSSGTTG